MSEAPAPNALARAPAPGGRLAGVALGLGAVAWVCAFAPLALDDAASARLLAEEPLAAPTLLGWLCAHAALLLPYGPLSLRVALAIALCGALALVSLYGVLWRLAAERLHPLLAAPLALGSALLALAGTGALAAHPSVQTPFWLLACLALDACTKAFRGPATRRGIAVAWLLSAALGSELIALAATGASLTGSATDPGDCQAGDLLAELDRRRLPARGLVLLGSESLRAFEAGELEEHARPDLTAVEKPWPLDLDAATALARRHPELQPLARAGVLEPALPIAALRALAGARPLLLELATSEAELYESVVPVGLLHQIQTSSVTRSELRAALRENEPLQGSVLKRLARARVGPQARSLLARRLRVHVEQLGSRGEETARKKFSALADPWLE